MDMDNEFVGLNVWLRSIIKKQIHYDIIYKFILFISMPLMNSYYLHLNHNITFFHIRD